MCSLVSLDDLNRFSRSTAKAQPPEVFYKKGVLISFIFHRKTPVLESLVIKLKTSNFIKKETPTHIFLWNLRNFQEHLYSKVSANDFFWFSESSISFFFFVWQILSISISTKHKLGLFLMEQPYLIRCSIINYV